MLDLTAVWMLKTSTRSIYAKTNGIHTGKLHRTTLVLVKASDLRLNKSLSTITCLRRTIGQLVLGRVTIFRRANTSVCNQPPRPTQPPTLCGNGNEYRPKCGECRWCSAAGSKGRTAHSIRG